MVREHQLPLPCSQFPLLKKRKAPHEAGPSGFDVVPTSARDHVHRALTLGAFDRKLHLAIDQREQRVVAAEADADARMELGAALAHDDVAGFDDLAAEQLDAEVFRVGVAAVARGTYALFVCHGGFSLLAATGDAGDLDFGVMLPVAHLLAMVLAAAEFHDAHLVGAAVTAHLGGDAGAGDGRRANGDALAFADQQHLVEGDRGIGFGIQFFDAKDCALLDAVLATAGENDCVHDVWLSGSVVILGVSGAIECVRTRNSSVISGDWASCRPNPNRSPDSASLHPGYVLRACDALVREYRRSKTGQPDPTSGGSL